MVTNIQTIKGNRNFVNRVIPENQGTRVLGYQEHYYKYQ